jgi:hypothetical protein
MALLGDELIKTSFLVLRKSKAYVSSRCDFSARGSAHALRLPEYNVPFNETTRRARRSASGSIINQRVLKNSTNLDFPRGKVGFAGGLFKRLLTRIDTTTVHDGAHRSRSSSRERAENVASRSVRLALTCDLVSQRERTRAVLYVENARRSGSLRGMTNQWTRVSCRVVSRRACVFRVVARWSVPRWTKLKLL